MRLIETLVCKDGACHADVKHHLERSKGAFLLKATCIIRLLEFSEKKQGGR